jgi:hypothetical protein
LLSRGAGIAEIHSQNQGNSRTSAPIPAVASTQPQGAYLGSKNTRKSKALRRLKTASREGIAFERINSVTMRIDQPHKKAIGWLMEMAWVAGKQRWIACVANHRSEPLPLEQAKEKARCLLRLKKAEPWDFIQELNHLAANEVDRAAHQRGRRRWPVDLMGGSHRGKVDSKLRQVILDTERVLIDEGDAA